MVTNVAKTLKSEDKKAVDHQVGKCLLALPQAPRKMLGPIIKIPMIAARKPMDQAIFSIAYKSLNNGNQLVVNLIDERSVARRIRISFEPFSA